MKKILAVTSVAFMLASGVAFAQTQPAPAGDPNAADKLQSISDPAVMTPFYTDASMATLRTDDEIKAAWAALTAEQQTTMTAECQAATSIKQQEFCGKIQPQ